MYLLRLMLVGVWLGLLWVLFYFFDHYIQSSVITKYRLGCDHTVVFLLVVPFGQLCQLFGQLGLPCFCTWQPESTVSYIKWRLVLLIMDTRRV